MRDMIYNMRDEASWMKKIRGWESMRTAIRRMAKTVGFDVRELDLFMEQRISSLKKELDDYRNRITKLDHDLSLLGTVEDLGEALVRVRSSLGITQSRFAQMAGIRPAQLSRYERTAYKSVSLTRVSKLAQILLDIHRREQSQASGSADDGCLENEDVSA